MTTLDIAIRAAMPDTLPRQVQDAQALHDAAQALLDDVTARRAPQLAGVTVKSLTQAHRDAVDYAVRHDTEVAAAQTLVKAAVERLDMAWQQAASAARPTIAAAFNTTAADFLAELARLGDVDPVRFEEEHWVPEWAELRRLSEDLTHLADARDAYAASEAKMPFVSTEYEHASRTAVFSDDRTATAYWAKVRNHQRSRRRWVLAAQTDGVTIRWQDPADQERQAAPAHVRERQDQLQASYAARVAS